MIENVLLLFFDCRV